MLKPHDDKNQLPGYSLLFDKGYAVRVAAWPGGTVMSVYEPNAIGTPPAPEYFTSVAQLLAALGEISARQKPSAAAR